MIYEDVKEKWNGRVNEIKLSDNLKIGGDTAFPCYRFEGDFPNKPAVAMEINDVYPQGWLTSLKESIGDETIKNPVDWAVKCVNEYDADLIFFDMPGTHQDKQNISPEESAENLNSVLASTDVPVIIRPSGNYEKQNKVISRCAQFANRQVILGSAVQENYRTIIASALASNHFIIAESPIDVNIAKQLNILITQMNFPLERIIMDPMTGGLGYGLEYTYSIMERIRLQTFGEDKMMSPPMICCVGQETWKIKEIRSPQNQIEQGINWEVTTAMSLILSGAGIIVVRHPESVKEIKKFINSI